jgi:hypothetical protein
MAGCCECGDEPSGSGATELGIHVRTLRLDCDQILVSSLEEIFRDI